MTFKDYYRTHYQGTNIQHDKQPLLASIVKPRRFDECQEERVIALIPELCFVTGLTDEQRGNFNVMASLLKETRLEPAQRKRGLQRFIAEVNGAWI